MGESDSPSAVPGWFFVLVVAAVIAGVIFAFWFYGVLSTPAVPQ